MTLVAAVHTALAPYRQAQSDITDMVADTCLPPGGDRAVLDRLHRGARVSTRHTVLPLEDYAKLGGFGAANDVFTAAARDLGAEAVRGALHRAGLHPGEVDLVMFTSVTGVAAPSIDARLVGPLGLREDVKRLPLFGLGCVAGAAGVARVHDYLRGWPGHVAVLLSVELCSLTFQSHDSSPANLVATALFGDGAAAVVLLGADRAPAALRSGPTVVATASRMYPDTGHVMGWDVTDSGFQVVLDPGVPEVVRRYLDQDVRAFLREHGLRKEDVATWVCHPGGPRVLEAVQESLGLPADALDLTWNSLREVGNLSSSSVLHVLGQTLRERRPPPGAFGLMLAMGPGFCCELVLLRW